MRKYETMYIVDPDLPDEEIEGVIAKYSKVVTDSGGVMADAARWDKGRRQLAYEIDKKREGNYVLMHFEAEAAVPKELDRIFRINDEIMRHLIIRMDPDEE